LSGIGCPARVPLGSVFDLNYSFFSTPAYAPFEIRGLLVDGVGSQCVFNDTDGVCSWTAGSFTTACSSPGVHRFNVTCVGGDQGYRSLCYRNEGDPLGCDVNCTVSRFKNVTLVYNVTTSASMVNACTVSGYVWYNGSSTPLSEYGVEPYRLECLTDESTLRGSFFARSSGCIDYSIRKNELNNFTLLNLPAPMQYWWNVHCSTSGGLWDVGDYNYTFILT
jgi:hypothetical protein